MTLKIHPSLPIERSLDIGNNNLLLSGHSGLEGIIPSISHLKDAIFSNFYQPDDQLLYHASLVCHGHDHVQEVGLGTFLQNENGEFYINRVRPIYHIDTDGTLRPARSLTNFNCNDSDTDFVVIKSHLPKTIQEILYEANVIVSCETPHLPCPIKIEENSFLGRLTGSLKSLSFNSIIDFLSSFKNSIKLTCSIFETPKLRTNFIHLKPSAKPQEQSGALYYDKDEDLIKYYNGTEWRILITQED